MCVCVCVCVCLYMCVSLVLAYAMSCIAVGQSSYLLPDSSHVVQTANNLPPNIAIVT